VEAEFVECVRDAIKRQHDDGLVLFRDDNGKIAKLKEENEMLAALLVRAMRERELAQVALAKVCARGHWRLPTLPAVALVC
jgi:hypothetical protein